MQLQPLIFFFLLHSIKQPLGLVLTHLFGPLRLRLLVILLLILLLLILLLLILLLLILLLLILVLILFFLILLFLILILLLIFEQFLQAFQLSIIGKFGKPPSHKITRARRVPLNE